LRLKKKPIVVSRRYHPLTCRGIDSTGSLAVVKFRD
jgi:hypothetical protein